MTPESGPHGSAADTIILIGPHRCGKTTAAELLSTRLSRPIVHFGGAGRAYWKDLGHDPEQQRAAWRSAGMEGLYRYLQPFWAAALELGLRDHAGCIIETDSLEMVFDDPALFAKAEAAIKPYDQAFLLLPSPDVEEAVSILEDRQAVRVDGMELNEHFVRDPSNGLLAKHTVYTKDRTPEETCEEVLPLLDPSSSTVVLIGPMGAGKSTIGRLLSEKLERPQAPLDDHRWDYYKEIGWSQETEKQIGLREGFSGVYRYWKLFEAHAVARTLEDHPGQIIDFGAGHSVYQDEQLLKQVQEALAPYPNVVLLLPSPDLDESVKILKDSRIPRINGLDLNRFILTHPSHRALARHVVYTRDRTPEETVDEIIGLLG